MKYLRITGLVGALAATAAIAPAASAAPVVTEATGADAASIQAAVDEYRNALGTNNAAGPPAPSGRRQIAWDGVPDDRSSPSFMPENQFRNVGALFSTPGLGFQVSGDDDADGIPPAPDADPDQVEFTNLNANYATAFAPFSPERLFAPIGSNVTETRFVVPATNTPADTNGFGAVFTDVDAAGQTTVELLAADGGSLGTYDVPATAGDASLSFLGVRYDAGERIAVARITTGAAPLVAPASGEDVTQGGPADIVAMDDFIYGEPLAIVAEQPDPEPPLPPDVEDPQPDTKAPQVQVEGAKRKIELRKLLRGLELTLTPDEAAAYEVTLVGSARSVELASKRGDVILAEKTLARAEGERELILKPKRKLLRETPNRFKVELRVEATDGAGNSDTVRKTIKVTS
jgi:hypothetical protein